MCLFTHFAAGALAGGVTGNPIAGAVAGLASHAVLDAIPHYDHPDWRLELGGGMISLVLLMLMPFASLPAILGGLCGMLPDLENLFQKLGKMRRDQFIYPSHTGLIPHGRALGPRTLVWQLAIFVVCFGLLGLLAPGSAAAAETSDQAVMGQASVQVLEAGQDLTRIQVRFPVTVAPKDWENLDLRQVRWLVPCVAAEGNDGQQPRLPDPVHLPLAVPTNKPVQVRLSGVSWWKEPTTPVDQSQILEFGVPAIFRSVPTTAVRLARTTGEGILRSAIIEISHPAQGDASLQLKLARAFKAAGSVDNWREKTPAGLLNPQLFQALARGGRELAISRRAAQKAGLKGLFNHFDLTGNWIRLDVGETGLYGLSGQQLANLGLDPDQVDPTKLRVFQGGGSQLDFNPGIPEIEQAERVGLTEVAIQVLDGGDGEWNLDDEIRFYGVGSSAWQDRIDPDYVPEHHVDSKSLHHYDHPYENYGVYWLTWEGLTTVSPLPGTPRRVDEPQAPALGGEQVSAARIRTHVEQQNVDAAGVVSDNWAWDISVYTTRRGNFNLHHPVADSSAQFIIDFRANPYEMSFNSHQCVANGWLNNDTAAQASVTFLLSEAQYDTQGVKIVGFSSDLDHGENEFTLENAGTTPRPYLALDSFDIMYWGELDIRDLGKQLDFTHWGEQVQGPGQAFDIQVSVQDPAKTVFWDVSDPITPRVLHGDLAAGSPATVTVGVARDPGLDLHCLALAEDDLLAVSEAAVAHPVSLRDQTTDVDYIVVSPRVFAQAAQELADFHNQEIVGIDNPAARVVLVEDIYDNFSGGRKDPLAIRNYLKYVYEDGHRLGYVCFLGNASRDHRNYKNHEPMFDLFDFIPAQLRTTYPRWANISYSYYPYSSDDGLTSFDYPTLSGDLDIPDLASGRLPASTLDEAAFMVDNVISYAGNPEPGLWRNQFLLTADDCNRPSHYPHPIEGQLDHTEQAEFLAGNIIPRNLDLGKVYGVDYDFPPGSLVKPQARADINSALNKGTSFFYYVGHGAEDNLADEQIFQSRDIANLTNGMKRPFFVAFSCDVGVYDNPIRRSMAETFVAKEDGGAIGSICASQVSTIYGNELLSERFFGELFPGREVVSGVTVSDALMLAKAQMATPSVRKNSQRFNLLGDPGTGLPSPVSDLGFAEANIDTLRSGARQVVAADMGVGKSFLGAGDSYDLRVEESAFDQMFIANSVRIVDGSYQYTPHEYFFRKSGSSVFRGSGTMDSDELLVPFKVPVQLRYGEEARVRLVVGGLDGERSAEMALPAVRSAIGPVDDVSGPAITLSVSNRYRVQPGDPLTTVLSDTSGIAILGTSPGNSILLEFDNTGFMTEVTESFNYEMNSYTTGRMVFNLPSDISPGEHTAAMYASDALGNVGSDTLSFTVTDYGLTGIKDMNLYPNPTAGECRLVFYLTDPMAVQWDIYTLSGRRLKTTEETFTSGGAQFMEWDGRDDQGDEIANGTYLYVLRGHWSGNEGRDINETGKLVIMR